MMLLNFCLNPPNPKSFESLAINGLTVRIR